MSTTRIKSRDNTDSADQSELLSDEEEAEQDMKLFSNYVTKKK